MSLSSPRGSTVRIFVVAEAAFVPIIANEAAEAFYSRFLRIQNGVVFCGRHDRALAVGHIQIKIWLIAGQLYFLGAVVICELNAVHGIDRKFEL